MATGTQRRMAAPVLAALAVVFGTIFTAGAGGCSQEGLPPTPAPTPPLTRQWEFVTHESDGDDLVVSVRMFAPVELTVVLDGERAPDESSVPEGLGIAIYRFRNVSPGEHSLRVTDAAGNSTSRGVKAGPAPVVAAGTAFVLKVGEKARVGDTGPLVSFTGVPEDSRCPTDAACIRAGEAVVVLSIAGTSVRVAVPREGSATATAAGYEVTVSNVSPLPSSTRSMDPEQYRATVRVEARPAP